MSEEPEKVENKEEKQNQQENEVKPTENDNDNANVNSNANANENGNGNNELTTKIKEMKTKFVNSKNNFISKLNNFVTELNTSYDKYIVNIYKNSNDFIKNNENNEESAQLYLLQLEDIFQDIEDLQNNILETNNNLKAFLGKDESSKRDKKNKKNEKILKINCGADIRECQKKLEKNLEKIIVKELSSDILEEIFLSDVNNKNDNEENKEKKNVNNNKQFNDVIIKKCNLENINLAQLFPNVNKFKLKKCQISFSPKDFFNFNKITELYLENLGLVNESFNVIISDLKKNINFINNIKIFSIKNNNISIFNLYFDEQNKDKKYNILQFLNLSNNKISKMNNKVFELLPSIKVIDLTDNYISFNSRYKSLLHASKEKKCILLLGKNPGVIKEKNRQEYCNYLKDCLPSLTNDYQIKAINLEGLFCGSTYPLLIDINLCSINIKLNTLDLSYNNLNDQDFIKLIDNNNEPSLFSNIKKLILCSNYITEAGLDSLINGGYHKIFAGLKKLNLSGNPIKFNDLNMFKKFIEGFPQLKTLLLRHTPLEKDFNNYLKIRVQRKMEENQKEELSAMSEIDLQFEELIEKEHYLREKTKLILKLMNTNGHKCLSMVRRYFPYLLENIKIETKFIDEDRINRIMA